jgi:hypothetical protein
MAIFGNRPSSTSGGGGGSAPSSTSGGAQRRPAQRRPNTNNRPNHRGGGGGGGGGHHGGGGGGAGTPPPLPGGTLTDDNTGIGTPLFNDRVNAIQGGLGLMQKGGIGGSMSPGNVYAPNVTLENSWLNGQMTDLYREFEGVRLANPVDKNLTWSNYLNRRFDPTYQPPAATPPPVAAPPPLPGTGHHHHGGAATPPAVTPPPVAAGPVYDPSAGMARYYRSLYSRTTPDLRGYLGPEPVGPGRTLTQ